MQTNEQQMGIIFVAIRHVDSKETSQFSIMSNFYQLNPTQLLKQFIELDPFEKVNTNQIQSMLASGWTQAMLTE